MGSCYNVFRFCLGSCAVSTLLFNLASSVICYSVYVGCLFISTSHCSIMYDRTNVTKIVLAFSVEVVPILVLMWFAYNDLGLLFYGGSPQRQSFESATVYYWCECSDVTPVFSHLFML